MPHEDPTVSTDAQGINHPLWYDPKRLTPLAENAVVGDEDGADVASQWQKLSLRCAFSFQPLTDPARCLKCTHISSCNSRRTRGIYERLAQVPGQRLPVDNIRSRDIVRDEPLRRALSKLPASAECAGCVASRRCVSRRLTKWRSCRVRWWRM